MCDTICSAMRPCGEPFCPYEHKSLDRGQFVIDGRTDPVTVDWAPGPVVVVLQTQWRRLVELIEAQTLASENGGYLTTAANLEMKSLIDSVEVPHD